MIPPYVGDRCVGVIQLTAVCCLANPPLAENDDNSDYDDNGDNDDNADNGD